ncbi:MAG: substrate-binding domain-containing protein [Chloroflexota bacterium]
MSRTIKFVVLMGVILSLALSACGAPTAAPAATDAPVTEAPVAEAPSSEPILTVSGAVDTELALSEADLRGMEVVQLNVEHPKNGPTDYEGVRLSEILAKAGVQEGASALVFTATDGYESEVPYADVEACVDCLVAFDGAGLNMVMPGMSSKAWAKMVAKIEVKGGAAVEPPANPTLILATTTSTQDSGLLDVLIPMFEEQSGYTVQTIAVGSGEAMKMGEEGNADVLLVHAPASEVEFMDGGFGKDRFLVMHNDFIIVGPAEDPAGIKGLAPKDAFAAIYNAGALFVSRGDDSGTHKKEVSFWKKAELDPAAGKPEWFIETGQGMGASLTVASEKGAYILTDRATYLANKDNLQLEILLEGDNSLLNVYHVITVNPEKWTAVNYEGAMAFAKFMTDPATQAVIGAFGVEKFGLPLFFPDADKTDADLGL